MTNLEHTELLEENRRLKEANERWKRDFQVPKNAMIELAKERDKLRAEVEKQKSIVEKNRTSFERELEKLRAEVEQLKKRLTINAEYQASQRNVIKTAQDASAQQADGKRRRARGCKSWSVKLRGKKSGIRTTPQGIRLR